MRNTRDGELTTMYAKQISKVLFLPWTLKFLTVYSGGLWNYITCSVQKIMEMVKAKVLAGFRMSIKILELLLKRTSTSVMCKKGLAQHFAS